MAHEGRKVERRGQGAPDTTRTMLAVIEKKKREAVRNREAEGRGGKQRGIVGASDLLERKVARKRCSRDPKWRQRGGR